jgi:hypothetical protein
VTELSDRDLARLTAALRRVRGDLDAGQLARRVQFRSHVAPADADDGRPCEVEIELQPAGAVEFLVDLSDEDHVLTARVAEAAQDGFGRDEDSTSWGPVCPVHGHPARAAARGREAVWVCPRGAWSTSIGGLGPMPIILVEPGPGRSRRARV